MEFSLHLKILNILFHLDKIVSLKYPHFSMIAIIFLLNDLLYFLKLLRVRLYMKSLSYFK